MPNFAVASSQETLEKADRIMQLYYRQGDKKEDTLLRILSVAEVNSVRGTHPELEESLKSIDSTICSLIKQINGIVSGQDNRIDELQHELDAVIEEKQKIIESSTKLSDEASNIRKAAEKSLIESTERIEEIKKSSAIDIERANKDRDHAIQERDDARIIAEEKTASNDLLMRQMSTMQADLEAYKKLLKEYENLKDQHKSLQQSIETMKLQQQLDLERAVVESERSMQEKLLRLERENAVLESQIAALTPND